MQIRETANEVSITMYFKYIQLLVHIKVSEATVGYRNRGNTLTILYDDLETFQFSRDEMQLPCLSDLLGFWDIIHFGHVMCNGQMKHHNKQIYFLRQGGCIFGFACLTVSRIYEKVLARYS